MVLAFDLDCSCLTCCCGGFGCCRQSIKGSRDSVAFLNAGGTIVYRQLAEGERIVVDSGSIVAIEQSVHLGLTPNGSCGMWCCGGEGCCATALTGPGKVFMQVSAAIGAARCDDVFLILSCETFVTLLEYEFPKVQSGCDSNHR